MTSRRSVFSSRRSYASTWLAGAVALGIAVVLAAQLPFSAVFNYHPKNDAKNAFSTTFVTLDENAYAATMRSVRMAWQLGRRAPSALELEIGDAAALENPLPEPRYLARNIPVVETAVFRPAVIEPRQPAALSPPTLSAAPVDALPPDPVGVEVYLSSGLSANGFDFPRPAIEVFPYGHGEIAFSVTTDSSGAAEAVLALPNSVRSVAGMLRRVIERGHASGTTNGFVRIIWNRPSTAEKEGKESR